MSDFVSRAFGGRRRVPPELTDRVPPGQYVEDGFPVLTVGPTPDVATSEWSLRVDGMVAQAQEWDCRTCTSGRARSGSPGCA